MLTDKVAVVTGAAQGIGLATARLMLYHGAKVSLADINETAGEATCSSLKRDFGRDVAIFTHTDVTDSNQLRHLFQKTVKVFGRIDIVCNNAGIADEGNLKRTVAVNLVAVMEGTHMAVEFMSTTQGGRGGVIINVSSMGGILPMPNAPNYCASKSGVVGFTRSMTECSAQHGVKVKCVCPQYTATSMLTANMMIQLVQSVGVLRPEQVAEAILQLVTDQSDTGAVMTVTLKKGIDYFSLPGDPGFSSKRESKL